MFKQTTHTLVRFSGHSKALDRWLQHRQLLVAGYQHLINNTRQRTGLPEPAHTQYWCQELIDYITAGHFQIFSHLLDSHNTTEIDNCYKNIAETTPLLLNLQQRVTELDEEQNSQFDPLLSALGEALSYRFELEDSLIASTITNKKQTTEVADDTCID